MEPCRTAGDGNGLDNLGGAVGKLVLMLHRLDWVIKLLCRVEAGDLGGD
jgi:hypothetical protein